MGTEWGGVSPRDPLGYFLVLQCLVAKVNRHHCILCRKDPRPPQGLDPSGMEVSIAPQGKSSPAKTWLKVKSLRIRRETTLILWLHQPAPDQTVALSLPLQPQVHSHPRPCVHESGPSAGPANPPRLLQPTSACTPSNARDP